MTKQQKKMVEHLRVCKKHLELALGPRVLRKRPLYDAYRRSIMAINTVTLGRDTTMQERADLLPLTLLVETLGLARHHHKETAPYRENGERVYLATSAENYLVGAAKQITHNLILSYQQQKMPGLSN